MNIDKNLKIITFIFLFKINKIRHNVYENKNNGVIGVNNQTFTVYGLPEKLEEQYEKRLAEKDRQIAEQQEMIKSLLGKK
jgi:hypothetical protein